MNKLKYSLSRKAFMGIVLILIPIFITFIWSYGRYKVHLKKQFINNQTIIAEAFEGQFYQFLEVKKQRTRDFVSDGFIRSQLLKIMHGSKTAAGTLNKHLIKNKLVVDESLLAIHVLSLDGRVAAATNNNEIGMNLSHDDVFIKGRGGVTIVENNFGHDKFTELGISAPILSKDTQKPIGVLVNYFNIYELNNILSAKYFKELGAVCWIKGRWKTMEVYLVNKDKHIVAESMGTKKEKLNQMINTLPVTTALQSGKEITEIYRNYRDKEVVGASMYIPALKWVLLVEVEKDEAFTPARDIITNVTVTFVIVTGAVVLIFGVFIKKIVKPLHKATDAAREIAGGNLGVTIPFHSEDEIGMLCSSFNKMSQDIKTRTAALLKSEERFELAVRGANDGIWDWDIVTNYNYFSDHFCELLGYESHELPQKYETWVSLVHPDEHELVLECVKKHLTEHALYNPEFRMRTKKGEYRWFQARGQAIWDQTGNPVRMVGSITDISERKRAEEEYVRLKEQLNHAQKLELVGRLAGGIAHDFNNLLMAITGYTQLLKMEISNDNPLLEYVEKILHATTAATQITQGLLALGRKQIVDLKPIDMNTLINKTKGFCERLITEDIEFQVTLTDKACTVMASDSQMEQVLMNLVTNARDAMPNGGRLAIRTEIFELDAAFAKTHPYDGMGSHVRITISDTGTGMDAKTKEHLFEPFFTTKEVGKGTGLGLSIAYGIIKQHNGHIDIQSEPCKGTTFNIYLPVSASGTGKTKTEIQGIPTGGTETILIAEDDAGVRNLIKTVLEKYGYTVIVAADGEDAVYKYLKHKDRIRLLLLDVIMPGKNGKEACNTIREIDPHVKIIFMSGYSNDVIHEKDALEKGFSFILKPVTPHELLKRVREVLDNPAPVVPKPTNNLSV